MRAKPRVNGNFCMDRSSSQNTSGKSRGGAPANLEHRGNIHAVSQPTGVTIQPSARFAKTPGNAEIRRETEFAHPVQTVVAPESRLACLGYAIILCGPCDLWSGSVRRLRSRTDSHTRRPERLRAAQ